MISFTKRCYFHCNNIAQARGAFLPRCQSTHAITNDVTHRPSSTSAFWTAEEPHEFHSRRGTRHQRCRGGDRSSSWGTVSPTSASFSIGSSSGDSRAVVDAGRRESFIITPATLRQRLEWLFGPAFGSSHDRRSVDLGREAGRTCQMRSPFRVLPSNTFRSRRPHCRVSSSCHRKNLCWESDILLVRCQHHVPSRALQSKDAVMLPRTRRVETARLRKRRDISGSERQHPRFSGAGAAPASSLYPVLPCQGLPRGEVARSLIWPHIQRHVLYNTRRMKSRISGDGGEDAYTKILLPLSPAPRRRSRTTSSTVMPPEMVEWSTPPTFDIYVRQAAKPTRSWGERACEAHSSTSRGSRRPSTHREEGRSMEWRRVGILHAIPALPLPPVNVSVAVPASPASKPNQAGAAPAVFSGVVLSLAAIMRFWGLLDVEDAHKNPTEKDQSAPASPRGEAVGGFPSSPSTIHHRHNNNNNNHPHHHSTDSSSHSSERKVNHTAKGSTTTSLSNASVFSFPPPLSLTASSKTERGLQSITDRRHASFRPTLSLSQENTTQSKIPLQSIASSWTGPNGNSATIPLRNSSSATPRVSLLSRHLRPSFNEVSFAALLERIEQEEKTTDPNDLRAGAAPSETNNTTTTVHLLHRRGVGVLLLLPPPSSQARSSPHGVVTSAAVRETQATDTCSSCLSTPLTGEGLRRTHQNHNDNNPDRRLKGSSSSNGKRKNHSRQRHSSSSSSSCSSPILVDATWGTSVCFTMLWWCQPTPQSPSTVVSQSNQDGTCGNAVSGGGHVFRAFHHFPTESPLFEFRSSMVKPTTSTSPHHLTVSHDPNQDDHQEEDDHNHHTAFLPTSFLVYAAPEVVGMWVDLCDEQQKKGEDGIKLPLMMSGTAQSCGTLKKGKGGARKNSSTKIIRPVRMDTSTLPLSAQAKADALTYSCLFLPSLSSTSSVQSEKSWERDLEDEKDEQRPRDAWAGEEEYCGSLDLPPSFSAIGSNDGRRNYLHRLWLKEQKDLWSRELIRTFADRMDNAAEMDYASRALPHSHGRVATENATMPASDRSKAEPIQFSSFPLSSQLLRNRRWLREPYTLAQEMEYGLIEML